MTDTTTGTTRTADAVAREFSIATPSTWHALELDPAKRAATVAALIEQVAGGRDDLAHVRRELATTLRETLAEAVDNGAFFVAIMMDVTRGFPVSASLVVSVVPKGRGENGEELTDPESLLDALEKSGGWRRQDLSIVDLAIGRGVRLRRQAGIGVVAEDGTEPENDTVQFFVPLEGTNRMVALTFSTPTLALADPFAKLFDVIADSAQWQAAPEEATSDE